MEQTPLNLCQRDCIICEWLHHSDILFTLAIDTYMLDKLKISAQ